MYKACAKFHEKSAQFSPGMYNHAHISTPVYVNGFEKRSYMRYYKYL